MAKVQLNNQTLMAKLEIPLTIGDHYHFQVQLSKNTIYLKVIGNKLKNNTKSNSSMLLKSLGIKPSETNRMFIQQLISEEIPFDKSQLVSAFRLLDKHKGLDRVESMLKEMITRQLPIKEGVLQALHTFYTSKQSELMNNVYTVINNKTMFQPVASLLGDFIEPTIPNLEQSKEMFLHHIQRYLTNVGLDYEFRVQQNKQFLPSIKGYLLQMLKSDVHAVQVEKLLHYINGAQINAVEETQNFIHINLNMPGENLGLNKDLKLEFDSRKTEKGKIDPDYCRIHFYLELPNLKETVIDMNIQQRNVSITVYNNTEMLKKITEPLQNNLKKGLSNLNYHLSTLTFKPLEKASKAPVVSHHRDSSTLNTRGVDYRI